MINIGKTQAQFELIEIPTTAHINDIHCFDNFCVVSDIATLIFKTYDLGESFVTVNSPVDQEGKYDLVCIDTSTFFIAGQYLPQRAFIFKTNDGGYTWDTLLDTVATYWAFDMLNEHKGILAGSIYGNILQTNNGWETTVLQSLGSPVYFVEAHFIDNNSIFLASHFSLIKSNDGGASWSNVTSLLQFPAEIYNISNNVVFVTANNNQGQYSLKKSIDGGNSWTTIFSGIGRKLYDILFIDDEGYITAYNQTEKKGSLLFTYDGGVTWQEILSDYDKQLIEIEQVNDSIIFVGGLDGLLLRFNRNQPLTGSREVSSPSNGLEIFPNPTTGNVTLRINNPVFSEIDATLMDVRGAIIRPVFKGIPGEEFFEQSIALDNLPAGSYFLRIVTKDGVVTKPVIKISH